MQRNICFIIVAVLFAIGCKSNKGPSPDTSENYLPLTVGSTWTYNDNNRGVSDKLVVKMTDATSTFNSKTYHNATTSSDKNGPDTRYFYAGEHTYSTRVLLPTRNVIIDLPLGNDQEAEGYTWFSVPTVDSTIGNAPARTYSKILKKDSTVAINSKTFTHVMITQSSVEYDTGFGFADLAVYDIYLAKGVGIIRLDAVIYDYGVDSQTIIDYDIK